MTDETFLINRAQNGDHRAFREIYERHVTALFRFMRQHSADTFQVEEWVQRAFIKAYRNIGSFQGSSRFSTWLFTIALNEMKTDLRRTNLISFDSEDLQNWNGHEETASSFVWQDTMKSWLADLSESKRMVFVLYEVEGYSHAEIASMLNIGESTSRALLSRAKQLLKLKIASEENII